MINRKGDYFLGPRVRSGESCSLSGGPEEVGIPSSRSTLFGQRSQIPVGIDPNPFRIALTDNPIRRVIREEFQTVL